MLMLNAVLTENTCGQAAVPADPQLRFWAELRSEPLLDTEGGDGAIDNGNGAAYWIRDGAPVIVGHRRDADTFVFEQEVIQPLPATLGPQTCALRQRDRLTLSFAGMGETMDADDEDAPQDEASDDELPPNGVSSWELTGTHVIGFAPTDALACEVVLTPTGPFEAMPCQLTYKLTGAIER